MPWRIHLSATVQVIKAKIGPFPVNWLQYFGVDFSCFPCSRMQAYMFPEEPHSGSQGALEDQVRNSMTQEKRISLKNNQPEPASEPQSKSNTWSFEKFKRLQERQNHLPENFLFKALTFFFNAKKYFKELPQIQCHCLEQKKAKILHLRGGQNL